MLGSRVGPLVIQLREEAFDDWYSNQFTFTPLNQALVVTTLRSPPMQKQGGSVSLQELLHTTLELPAAATHRGETFHTSVGEGASATFSAAGGRPPQKGASEEEGEKEDSTDPRETRKQRRLRRRQKVMSAAAAAAVAAAEAFAALPLGGAVSVAAMRAVQLLLPVLVAFPVREVVFWLIWCLCPGLLVAYRAVQVWRC